MFYIIWEDIVGIVFYPYLNTFQAQFSHIQRHSSTKRPPFHINLTLTSHFRVHNLKAKPPSTRNAYFYVVLGRGFSRPTVDRKHGGCENRAVALRILVMEEKHFLGNNRRQQCGLNWYWLGEGPCICGRSCYPGKANHLLWISFQEGSINVSSWAYTCTMYLYCSFFKNKKKR